MNWTPLHQHSSDGSLLDGASSVDKMVKRCKALGFKACTLSEHGSIATAVKLEKACKKAEIKAIRGCELYLSPNASDKSPVNRKMSHLVVLSKNLQGWKQLIKITSRANREDFFYYKPRIDLDNLAKYCDGNLVSFSGHPGSDLSNLMFTDLAAYGAKTYEDAKMFVDPNWVQKVSDSAARYQDIFGKGNFFIEIQLIDQENTPACKVIAEGLRYISKKTGIPCVATADSHYAEKSDAPDQRVLICSSLQTTLKEVQRKMDNDEFGLESFFKSNNYHVPTQEEIEQINLPDEIANTQVIEEMCENYTILNKATLPNFAANSEDLLRQACRDGWGTKIAPYVPKEKHQEYTDRIKKELDVIQGASLSDYFLIVKDVMDYAKTHNILTGPGRGSAAGCMVSYLCDITKLDPIRFGLIFERFYNAGRNSKDHVEYPDIDCDFPTGRREEMIEYTRNKYGHDKVAQICTYGRMMGREAIKTVFRVHSAMDFDEMDKVTEHIPDEARIADDLQVMKEEGRQPSIIRWALENNAKELKDYCELDGENLTGPLAKLFAQAMRLEGTAKTVSKHASGLVISPYKVDEWIPMVRDKSSNELMIALELDCATAYGAVKFDYLGLNALDKIQTCLDLIG